MCEVLRCFNIPIEKSKKQLSELRAFRQSLYNKLSPIHLDFKAVTLANGITLNISRVVKIDGYYLPVTAKETFDFARHTGFFPLTRSVADHLQNKAIFLPYRWQPELLDFEQYSTFLNSNSYCGIHNFGAHKLWVLSNRRGIRGTRAINYGFYESRASQAAGTPNRGGTNLNPKYNPKQGLGGLHDDHHWDYSQLLQLMYASTPLTINGEKMSLGMALRAGSPIVTDEGAFDNEDLP